MVSSSKKLCILMWKCLILRRRNWLVTLFELAIPILVAYGAYAFLASTTKPARNKHFHSSNFIVVRPRNILNMPVRAQIAYTPSDTFTNEIMKDFFGNSSEYKDEAIHIAIPKKNEEELEKWLNNNTLTRSYPHLESIGIIFIRMDAASKTFKYKIRTNSEFVKTEQADFKEIMCVLCGWSEFLNVQIRVDNMILESAGVTMGDEERRFGPYPTPQKRTPKVIIIVYLFLVLAYISLVASVVRDVIQEKTSGIKEYMKIMGVSTWMIWAHWMMYTLIVHLPVTIIISFILTNMASPLIPANFFLVWIIFVLFIINCVVLLFVLTCFFNGHTIGTVVCVCGWCSIHLVLIGYVIDPPSSLGIVEQILLCAVPFNNLMMTLYSIASFHEIGLTWTLAHMFTKGSTGSYISVGLAIIIFLSETIVLIAILAFLDTIKPGPYGVAKPITFLCQCCIPQRRRSHVQNENITFLPKRFEPPPKEAKIGIKLRELHKCYGRFKKIIAVENLDLDIYEGEIMALLGHNGAGKTTTMSLIAGMFSPSRGVILYDGQDINSDSNYRDHLGVCTQHNLYIPKLTVIEHLVFFGMLKGISYYAAKTNSFELLQLLKLAEKMDSPASTLSDGMKRRLCLAVSLVGNPKILILDEPTSGLDPEARRHIWNIILSMRGRRTIIITTHSMEEADVLGDRIAIMVHGSVVCCGTTMFLKKLYGTGYHIHIQKGVKSVTDDIIYLVGQYIPNPQINLVSPTQIDFTIKDIFVETFPRLFAALEKLGSSLDISGITVTCTTMEDVFLKVAEKTYIGDAVDHEEMASPSDNSLKLIVEGYVKTDDCYLLCQRFDALILKRMRYRLRNIGNFTAIIISTSLMIVMMMLTTRLVRTIQQQLPLLINLGLYPNSTNLILYDEEYKLVADIAAELISDQKGFVKILPNNTDIIDYLIRLAGTDFVAYAQTATVIQLRKSNFIMQHSGKSHLPVVAANLMSNIILRNFTIDNRGIIEIINHPYTVHGECDTDLLAYSIVSSLRWLIYFSFSLILLMVDFIPFVTEERVTGFKHHQILTGVSPLLYWLVIFVCDYCLYLCFIAIFLGIIAVFEVELFLRSGYIGYLVLVLVLYGISGLFFVYLFTFFIDSTLLNISLFISFNIFFGIFPAILLKSVSDVTYFPSSFITAGFLGINPLFSASISLYKIAIGIAHKNVCNVCKREFHCNKTKQILSTMLQGNKYSILIHVICLTLDWLLYFTIIMLFEYGCIRWTCMVFRHAPADFVVPEETDEDVKNEIERVKIMKESHNTSTPLRVEGLMKKYFLGPTATNKVSFIVAPGECFGLLGVNGAGKTTTFKVLTGEVFPNSGDAVILEYSLISERRKYQVQVGYCPQFDAFPNALTGKEILEIIAHLRGIPRKDVNKIVDNWLATMDISEHANIRTEAYSGGTKRKLSIAMAFIGNPAVVFLDEPTTGVDPESRRKLWSVMQARQKAGQAIVLTSHSMQECETLCTRLTIMRDGQMKCIGTTEYLKTKFSQGYTVHVKLVNPTSSELRTLKAVFRNAFPLSDIKDEHITQIRYHIRDPTIALSRLFSVMIELKHKYTFLEDFTVTNTTLEQVFSSFAQDKIKIDSSKLK